MPSARRPSPGERRGPRIDVLPWSHAALAALRRRRRERVPVIVVLCRADAEAAREALLAGAAGVVVEGEDVEAAARSIAAGGLPLSPSLTAALLDPPAACNCCASSPDAEGRAALSRRERDILSLFARGLTYAEVGCVLAISLNTVREHVRSMYRKLDVTTKAEAVGVFLRRTDA